VLLPALAHLLLRPRSAPLADVPLRTASA
jgi:hypothetical protein